MVERRLVKTLVVVALGVGALACASSSEDAWWCSKSSTSCSCYFGGERPASEHPGVTQRTDISCSAAAIATDAVCCADDGDKTCFCSVPRSSSGGACSRGRVVSSCNPPGDAPASGSSSSSGATADTCSDVGFCGPTIKRCECGTSCLHLGVGRYTCGFSCQKDADCATAKDPTNGKSLPHCSPGLDTPTITYSGMCGG